MSIGITRSQHGIADYAYAPLVWMAPTIAGFKYLPQANLACKTVAVGALTYSLLTDYEWGAAPLIPYKAHLVIDFVVGAAAVAAPWMLGVEQNKKARNTFLIMGAVSLVVGVLSVLGAKNSD